MVWPATSIPVVTIITGSPFRSETARSAGRRSAQVGGGGGSLKHVPLAHLSSECNSPELALKMAQEALQSFKNISIAHQDQISKSIYF